MAEYSIGKGRPLKTFLKVPTHPLFCNEDSFSQIFSTFENPFYPVLFFVTGPLQKKFPPISGPRRLNYNRPLSINRPPSNKRLPASRVATWLPANYSTAACSLAIGLEPKTNFQPHQPNFSTVHPSTMPTTSKVTYPSVTVGN
jgi:hypothetical protein